MDEDEDDYISFGTPLPEIEEESVLRKKAAREQEVRDEKGRQRFHGAFTGGFSAGYFNTVGTKEGWAPSTFVSSRDKKSTDCMQQNPEDFMDDEDFGAFGIATRKIHTTSNFQDPSDARSSKRKFIEVDSVIPGEAPLKDIVRPVSESIGIKILRKLGWKPGQGIGPRIKKIASIKIYGCSLPEAADLEEDDPYAQSFTFAPDDTEAETYQPKDNVFGLGYSGLSKESVLKARIDTFTPTTTKSWLKKDKKKLAISGQAFGVGAFEDDDEDIYSKDDMSQYDFSDLELKGNLQTTNTAGNKNPSIAHVVLEGFCLASQPPAVKKYYPPPQLPPNFRPVCMTAVRKIAPTPETQFKPRHNFSADERSFLLGEKKFQPFKLGSEKKNLNVEPVVENINKTIPKNTHSFRPFPNDESKQKRYEEYLVLKDLKELHKLVQPSSMTEWEKQQELEEFSRAAMLFKPLSSALSAKFESRSHLDVEHEVMDALAKARKESTKKAEEKRKLVGMHNRKTSEWHPASLLCKRFNVPNPYPNSSEVSGSQKSKSLFDHISFDSRETAKEYQLPSSSSEIEAKEETIPVYKEKFPGESSEDNMYVSANKNDIIQEQPSESGRPPIDFFKDIFENSSSDEEDSPAAETENPKTPPEVVEEKQTPSASMPDEIVPNNKTAENKKVGFGVFANLDLDALNKRTPKVKTEQTENNESKCEAVDTSKNILNKNGETGDRPNVPVENSSLSADLYGPELPPNYCESSYSTPSKFESRKKAKHKVKHKHKHHKHKNKKKKKKHSSHKSSEDSSIDSDEDIPPAVILEKLKKLQKVLK